MKGDTLEVCSGNLNMAVEIFSKTIGNKLIVEKCPIGRNIDTDYEETKRRDEYVRKYLTRQS